MLDNPIIRPEWEYPESASLDDEYDYDRDSNFLREIIRENAKEAD